MCLNLHEKQIDSHSAHRNSYIFCERVKMEAIIFLKNLPGHNAIQDELPNEVKTNIKMF